MDITDELGIAQWLRTQPSNRSDIQGLENGIHRDTIAGPESVVKADRRTIHYDQVDLGVPVSDLLVEDRSANTFDNVRFSVDMLNECGLLPQLNSILLVSSEWHMRRVLLTARRYLPSRIRLVCCPTCEGCNRHNWTKSEECRGEVEQEATLLEAYLATGALDRNMGA
jgi:hypothetical protein